MKNLLALAVVSLLGAAQGVLPARSAPEAEADLLLAAAASSPSIAVDATIGGGSAASPDAPTTSLSDPSTAAARTNVFDPSIDGAVDWYAALASDSDGDDPCVSDDLWPLWFDFDPCPGGFTVTNYTECTYYIRVFYDCDGDGLCDGWDEYFIMDTQDGEKPWKWKHEPDPGCTIIGWGIFDVLPLGGCWPKVLPIGCEYFIG